MVRQGSNPSLRPPTCTLSTAVALFTPALHTQAHRGTQANPKKRAAAAQLPQNARHFSASSHAALHGLDDEDDARQAPSELPPANSIVTLVENRHAALLSSL